MTKKRNQRIAGPYVNIHTKYDVSMIMYVGRRANQRKIAKCYHLKTICQNNQKCNQHIVGTYVHIHHEYKVSGTM